MRVIAGTARGRRLSAPPGLAVRPTSDRVKEALFSSIQSVLRDADVLDLFAGSGALGIEALSRGAARATFVELSAGTAGVIRGNLKSTGLSADAQVLVRPAADHLRDRPAAGAGHTLVFLDPPYDLPEQELGELLAALVAHLDPRGATVVVERDAASPQPSWPAALEHLRDRAYGSTRLHIAATSLEN